MITYKELNDQNHKITELSNILSHLLKERSLCDNGECCKVFSNYMEQVNLHMDAVDRNLYSELLLSEDAKVNNTAKSFMEGSIGIKRILKQYTAKWCSKADSRFVFGRQGQNYDKFLEESEAMFSIVLDRIQRETELLYPLVRELKAEQKAA